jgi:hypothetical protein
MCEAPTAVIGYRVRTAVEPSRREGFPYDAKTRAGLAPRLELSTGMRARPAVLR